MGRGWFEVELRIEGGESRAGLALEAGDESVSSEDRGVEICEQDQSARRESPGGSQFEEANAGESVGLGERAFFAARRLR